MDIADEIVRLKRPGPNVYGEGALEADRIRVQFDAVKEFIENHYGKDRTEILKKDGKLYERKIESVKDPQEKLDGSPCFTISERPIRGKVAKYFNMMVKPGDTDAPPGPQMSTDYSLFKYPDFKSAKHDVMPTDIHVFRRMRKDGIETIDNLDFHLAPDGSLEKSVGHGRCRLVDPYKPPKTVDVRTSIVDPKGQVSIKKEVIDNR